MRKSLIGDDDFFRQVVLNISSSLDLAKSLRTTYDFLSNHFPLEGISLHTFNPRMQALHLLFLVTSDDFYYLDELVPLKPADANHIQQIEHLGNVINAPSCNNRPITRQHSQAIKECLPYKDRAYLITTLTTGKEVVGHLCLVGNDTGCFTHAHEHKLRLMVPPISLAMLNMLQYRRTLELQKRLDTQRHQLAGEVRLLKKTAIIGDKQGLRKTMESVGQLAGKITPVLILGETGTGKELIADVIQRISPRSTAPYVKVNCGAIPETLVDSELFGHRKGAFTGADADRVGRFEQADGGTLFLDEVGDLPPQVQVRLLRVLEDKTVTRLGSQNAVPVNVRIIAATNRPLESMLQNGRFREDLFYRLNVYPIRIPALRKRPQDIPLLVHHFLDKMARQLKLSQTPKLAMDAMPRLQTYSWPGNVRELENLIHRALTLNSKGPLNLHHYLPQDPEWYLSDQESQDYLDRLVEAKVQQAIKKHMPTGTIAASDDQTRENPTAFKTLDQVMADHIGSVLKHCWGKIHGPGGAAEILGIHPSTLCKRMDKLGIAYGRKRK